MKVYSIGREMGCDIVINDSSDVISRRHAILNVFPSGKMTIVDQSHNGTYVNGIKISANVPVPVTRKDNVSFAHVARLDWNQIPKSTSITQYIIYGVIAIIVIVGGIVGYNFLVDSPISDEPVQVQKTDTISVEKKNEEVVPTKPKESETQNPRIQGTKRKNAGKSTTKQGGSEENKEVKGNEKPGDSNSVSKGARH